MKDFKMEKLQLESRLKELFKASMQGDQVAYENFLNLTSAFVKRYLFYLGGKAMEKESIEDLHQEVMISIHQKKQTYQLDKPILPWIHAISRYRYIDLYRSKKRTPKMVEFDENIGGIETVDSAISFAELLEFLTPKQQQLLQLIKIEGATYVEAADALHMSVPSAKVGIHRILKSLKERSWK